MKVLVIAPHPDDEAIGCGGALCLHADRDDKISVVFLTSGEQGLQSLSREAAHSIREKEAHAAAEILGIGQLHFLRGMDGKQLDEITKAADALATILKADQPELVYLPHEREWHPDHKAALPILCKALTQADRLRPKMRSYEIWTPISEHTEVEDISAVIERKMQAVRAHTSQVQQWPYDRAVEGLNQYRGAMAGRCAFAEVFEIVQL